jgi:tRNA threonylcarbamoyladenosine biosynthesis protein TsaB
VAAGNSSPIGQRWIGRERVNPGEYNIASMRLLALETVTRAGSLALGSDESACVSAAGDPRTTHGIRLPAELLDFVAAHGHALPDIDAFVVVTGPGSFTGLRVGLATIQGFALAGRKPVIGVPTLDAMASGWRDRHEHASEWLVACLDGARGDVFYALHDLSGASTFERARVAIEPSVATPAQAATRIRGVIDDRPLTLIGDGAERYRDVFTAQLPAATIAGPMPNLAEGALRLALRQQLTGGAPHALRPVYIRRTDAELARDIAAAALDFTIGPVTDADGRREVAALHARVFGPNREAGAADTDADAIDGGEANRHIARVQAARDRNGTLIGYATAWLIVDELHIHDVAVDPAFRRRGAAKALLERVLAEARASGATSATLEVRRSNAAAVALYEKLGFMTEAVRPAYYRDPTEDALILWRRKL